MYTIGGMPIMTDELYHHGVMGMKWGIRRYQPYGTAYQGDTKGKFTGKIKQAIKERREAKSYDYKKHKDYAEGNAKSRRAQTNQYNLMKNMVGKKRANKIEYKIREKGADRKKEYKKAVAGQIVKGVAATAALTAGTYVLTNYLASGKTPQLISNAKKYIKTNNYVTGCLKSQLDLKEYTKPGITTGIDSIMRGKKLFERMTGSR